MEKLKTNSKIMFNKSGRGTVTPRIGLPVPWCKKMNLTEEDREVELEFDLEKNQIIIKKIVK